MGRFHVQDKVRADWGLKFLPDGSLDSNDGAAGVKKNLGLNLSHKGSGDNSQRGSVVSDKNLLIVDNSVRKENFGGRNRISGVIEDNRNTFNSSHVPELLPDIRGHGQEFPMRDGERGVESTLDHILEQDGTFRRGLELIELVLRGRTHIGRRGSGDVTRVLGRRRRVLSSGERGRGRWSRGDVGGLCWDRGIARGSGCRGWSGRSRFLGNRDGGRSTVLGWKDGPRSSRRGIGPPRDGGRRRCLWSVLGGSRDFDHWTRKGLESWRGIPIPVPIVLLGDLVCHHQLENGNLVVALLV